MGADGEEKDGGVEILEEVSLRDTIAEAMDEQEKPEEKKDESKPVKEASKEEKAGKDEEVKEVKEGKPAKEGTPATPAVNSGKSEKAVEIKEIADPKIVARAPGSWKPAAREKWAALPPEIQQEVLRREKEIANGFNETTNVRKFHEQFSQVVSPYQHIVAAEGGDALKTVNSLFVTAASLYNGSTAQKASTIANLVKSFGVDINTLDSILAGQATAPSANNGNQDAATYIQQQIQQALSPIMRGQQQQSEQAQKAVATEIETFASDPKNEWYEDVRDTMADLLEVAAKQGKQMDLSTAYNRATMMHADIADVVSERKLQEKAATQSAAAAAAKRKAVSVKGAPAKSSSLGKGDNLRADLQSAIESLST